MIEETATVIQCSKGLAILEAQRQSTCGSCAAKSGCGTAGFAKTLGKKSSQITVTNTLNLQVGDKVMVGLHENALLLGSFVIYLIPLAGLLLFAIAGKWFSQQLLHIEGELFVISSSITGFLFSLWLLKKFNKKIKNDVRFQPVVLRKLIN